MEDFPELSRADQRRWRRFGLRTYRAKRRELGDADLAIDATRAIMVAEWEREHPDDQREAGDRDWEAFFDFLLEFIRALVELFSSLSG